MKHIGVIVVSMAVLGLPALPAAAQQQAGASGDMQKLADEYIAAWSTGDAKAVAALHARDGFRLTATGQLGVGRAQIEQQLQEGFAGQLKGSKLTVRTGQTRQVTPELRVTEGTYEITGVTAPAGGKPPAGLKGRFLNTAVREDGRWVLASSSTVEEQPPAASQ